MEIKRLNSKPLEFKYEDATFFVKPVATEEDRMVVSLSGLSDGEWDKFIAGTSSSFALAITGSEMAGGSTPFSLALDIPEVYYQAAPIPIGSDLIKIAFTAVAVYNTSSGYTSKATLVNNESEY